MFKNVTRGLLILLVSIGNYVSADTVKIIDAKSITGLSVGYFNDKSLAAIPVYFESQDGTLYVGEAKNAEPSTGYLSARVLSKCQKSKCEPVKGDVFSNGFYGLKTVTFMSSNSVLLNQYAALSVKLMRDATDNNTSSGLQAYMRDMISKTQPVLIAEPQEVKLFVKE